MDKLKVGVNIALIIVVLLLFICILLINRTNQQITAQVIANINDQTHSDSLKFYTNNISYSFSQSCSDEEIKNMLNAFRIVEEKVNLSFYETKDSSDIIISCLNLNIQGLSKVAEGGPTLIADNNILEAKIILYDNSSDCPLPIIELHELFHALGLEHSNEKNSVMYPILNCNQEINQEVINILIKLYNSSKKY